MTLLNRILDGIFFAVVGYALGLSIAHNNAGLAALSAAAMVFWAWWLLYVWVSRGARTIMAMLIAENAKLRKEKETE